MSFSITSTVSSKASNVLQLTSFSGDEEPSPSQMGPANLENGSIFNRAIVNARTYGPSPEWLAATAWQTGIAVPHTPSLDAHLQHRFYHRMCTDESCDAPVLGPAKNLQVSRLETAARSNKIGASIDGVLPARFLDRTTGITVQRYTQVTPSQPSSSVYHPPWYPPASPPSTLDPTKTLRHFDLFTNLPMEMVGCIIQQCTPGDAVALSLTCKTLYSFARPLIIQGDFGAFFLAGQDRSWITLCSKPRTPETGVCRSGACQRRGCNHCLCVDCPLWTRLVSWMPKNLKYCRDNRCGKFMLRRKFKNGRCYHGSSPRAPPRLLNFTYRKNRGGFSTWGREWKKYYKNEDMKVAMDRYLVERNTESGYGLRKRPKPTMKRVEHVNQRFRGKELTKLEMYGG